MTFIVLCLSNLYQLYSLSNTTLWMSLIHSTYCGKPYTAIRTLPPPRASTWLCVMGSCYGALPSQSLDTPQLVGLLWTNYEPNTETSTWQHNTHKRQTSLPLAGFKPTLPASERVQANALDRIATRIGCIIRHSHKYIKGMYFRRRPPRKICTFLWICKATW